MVKVKEGILKQDQNTALVFAAIFECTDYLERNSNLKLKTKFIQTHQEVNFRKN